MNNDLINKILEIIEQEPEYPNPPPQELIEYVDKMQKKYGTAHIYAEQMRIAVQVTKFNIRNNIIDYILNNELDFE